MVSFYIPVIKKGNDYLAVCPFHPDTHPSLHVSPKRQIFKCFVDGKGGNAISFVMEYEHLDFWSAARKVASIMGLNIPELENRKPSAAERGKEPYFACMKDLVAFYSYQLKTAGGHAALEYLRNRGISDQQSTRFGLGYAPEDGEVTVAFLRRKGHTPKTIEGIGIANVSEKMADVNHGRLVFPIYDLESRPIGLSCRRLSADKDIPKYQNSPETVLFHKSSVLYGANLAARTAREKGYVYVLEGLADVIALDSIGEPAVALMGTALTAEHLKILRTFGAEIRLSLDGDAAGQHAMYSSLKILDQSGIPYRLVQNTDERDVDDVLREEGEEALRKRLNNLVDPFAFRLSYFTNTKKPQNERERQKLAEAFIPYLASLPEGIKREEGIVRLSQATGYSSRAINSLLLKPREKKTSVEGTVKATTTVRKGRSGLSRLASIERDILYYMLNYEAALVYFKEKIDAFITPEYEEIANYLMDAAGAHDGKADLALLLGLLEEDGADQKLVDEITDIASEDFHPAYSEKDMDAARDALNEEKANLALKAKTTKSLQGKNPDEQAAVLEEFAKRRKQLLEKQKKGTN